jgi:hypothetical protein
MDSEYIFDALERSAFFAKIDNRFRGCRADTGDLLQFRGGCGVQVDRLFRWMLLLANVDPANRKNNDTIAATRAGRLKVFREFN